MRAFATIIILGLAHIAGGQNLQEDIKKAKDFLVNSREVTVELSMDINYTSIGQNQHFEGKIIKYRDTYCTSFNNKTMLNDSDFNLIIDHNQQIIFVRNSVQSDESQDALIQTSLQNMDSLLESSNFTESSQNLGQGRIRYTFKDDKNLHNVEIVIGREFLEKMKYKVIDNNGRSILINIDYKLRKQVNANDLKTISRSAYVNLKDRDRPQLSEKYAGYQLVNNLTP